MPRKATEREAVINVTAAARRHAAQAINVLAKGLSSEDERVRLDAAKTLLDRGYGKAVQPTELALTRRPAAELSDDELAAIASQATNGALQLLSAPEEPSD